MFCLSNAERHITAFRPSAASRKHLLGLQGGEGTGALEVAPGAAGGARRAAGATGVTGVAAALVAGAAGERAATAGWLPDDRGREFATGEYPATEGGAMRPPAARGAVAGARSEATRPAATVAGLAATAAGGGVEAGAGGSGN